MRRLIAILLTLLALAGCGPVPSPESAPFPSPAPETSSAPEPVPAPEEAPSVVEALAAARIQALGVTAADGETAIREAYRYLVRSVYFADPVGLDLWRYLTADNRRPIPYIENRALSPLLLEIGSCEDFAAAMVLLLRAAGFEAEYVAGYTLSVEQVYIDHAWAVVRLDGQWYHLDPQLEQNVSKSSILGYRYYMKSDADFLVDHKWGENLIEHWSGMPEAEKQAIRAHHIPPACPQSLPAPAPEPTPLPPRPNMAEVQNRIDRIRAESGFGELPPIRLNVEPPILVRAHHITPPLLEEQPEASGSAAAPLPPAGHGRAALTGESAALYDRLAQLAPQLGEETTLALSHLSHTDIKQAVDAFCGDRPTYYWIRFTLAGSEGERRLTLTPTLTREEIAAQGAEIAAAAEPILRATRGLSPFEAALAIHDHLAANIRYDYSQSAAGATLYGALVEQKAYCDGYAKAFQYLAEQGGLRCAYLTGKSRRGVEHAWNALYLDGSWHYVDVTWDRPRRPEDRVYHDYFLIGAAELLRERQPDSPPEDGAVSDYYQRSGYALSGTPDADRLAAVFLRQLQAHWSPPEEDGYAAFFLEAKVDGSPEDYAAWKELYIKQVFEVLRQMEAGAREQGLPFTISYTTSVRCDFNDVMQVFTFYPLVKEEE